MLTCVVNVSEGRDAGRIADLSAAAGAALVDVHTDADHHRSVLTLAAPDRDEVAGAARALATAVADRLDLRDHDGVHPRFGALDVVPFVALDRDERPVAATVAQDFARWWSSTYSVPVFCYDDADPHGRSLPDARRLAFVDRPPDLGPGEPHPALGATAVGARAPLVAVNCLLDTGDLDLARRIARAVRARDGGLAGVRALGFYLASAGRAQVSMNLVDLPTTGIERACGAVREQARRAHTDVVEVELVGLLPAEELARCDPAFVEWAGISEHDTVEARVARRR